MTLLEIFDIVYNEETLPVNKNTGKKKKGILLLDVDDTLLQARDIFIWRKLPTDKKEVKLTPAQYADEHPTPEEKKYYSYREFRDPVKVANSIRKGLPYINNLKAMDNFISGGYKIGILTARGMEDVVFSALSDFLKYRAPDGSLKPAPLNRKYVFAVNDEEKFYRGETDYEKKKNVINKIRRYFDYVYFMDDDIKNLKAVKQLKKELPEKQAKKIRTITAKKPDNIEEGFLIEMAVKDVIEPKFVEMIESGNLKDAGYYYIDKVMKGNPGKYANSSWIDAAHGIGGRGIVRTLNTAVRAGQITQEFANKVAKAIDLAVSNPPKERLEKDALEKEEKEKQSKEQKELEKNKGLSGNFPEYEKNIVKAREEKKRIADIVKNFLDKYIVSGGGSENKETIVSALMSGYKSDLAWVMNKFLPSFIAEKQPSLTDKKNFRRSGFGDKIKEESIKVRWYLKQYNDFLQRTIDEYEYIVQDREMSNSEKEEELQKSAVFREDYDKLVKHFKTRPKDAETKKIEFKAIKVSEASDSASSEAQVLVSDYYRYLDDLEDAYVSGKMADYVRRNYKKIVDMLTFSSYAARNKLTNTYKKPSDIDSEEIEEAEEMEDTGSLSKTHKFGPNVLSIVKERTKPEYKYSGIERDAPEISYLKKFADGQGGNDKTAFRIIANIYLDFLDGINTVVSAKNIGTGSKEGKERLKKIIQKKQNIEKSKERESQGENATYEVEDIKSIIDEGLSKVSNEEEKERIQNLKKVVDFSKISQDTAKKIDSSVKKGNLYEFLSSNEDILNSISTEEMRKIVEREIAKMSQAERFERRIAVAINFNGNKFSDSQIKQLAKSALADLDGKALKAKLLEPEFSTKIQK
jgi:hypothetical protein